MNLPRVRSPPNSGVAGAATAQPSPLINARKLILINPNNGSSSSQATPITPRVLDISFLPHSVTEQWLLVQSVDELSLILEEIIAIYSSLSSNMKEKAKGDISKVIRQIIVNMACEALQVVINGLKLMELFAEDHAEAFLPEVATLFPKLLRYFEDSRVVLRHHVSRLAYSLAAHLPFRVMDKFIVFAVEQGRKASQGRPEYSFKLAVIALMRCVQVRANYKTTVITSQNSSIEDPVSTFQATHTAQQLSLVRIAATAAACITSSDVITELTKDISIDIVGAAYKLLYPSLCEDADVDTLPEMFLDLLVLDEDCTINIPMQKVITKRAKNTLFSSILSDVTIYPLIQHLLGLTEADNETEASNSAAYSTFVSPTPSAAALVPDEVAILSPSTPSMKSKYNFTLTLNSNTAASPHLPISTSNVNDNLGKENVPSEIESLKESLKELFIDNSSKKEAETATSAEVPVHSPNSKGNVNLFIEKPITTPNTSVYSPLPFALVKIKPTFLEAVEESPRDKDVDSMPPINRRDNEVSNSRRNSKDNITKRGDKHKRNSDHSDALSALNYTPSWGSNSITLTSSDRTLDSPWTPNMLGESDTEDSKVTLSVDRSKLKSIKKAGKKPGSRRAHSAEVSTNLHDAHAVNDRTPNTSDGVRSISIAASNIIGGSGIRNGSKFKNTGDEDDGPSIAKKYNNFNSVPNYLEETEQISRKREAFMERVALQVIDKNFTSDSPDNSHSHSTKKSMKTSPRQEKPFREEKLIENDTLSSYINKNYNKNNATASTTGDKVPQTKRRNIPKPIEIPRDEASEVDINTDTFYSQSEKVPPYDQRKRRDQGASSIMSEISENSSLLSPDRGRTSSVNNSYFDSSHKATSTPTASTNASGEYKSGLKPEALEYLDASEIEPSTNPTKEFNKAMLGLDTQDWPEIFNTLNSIRCIALHHRSLITNSGSLHSIVVGVLRQVDNLRSAVAKNAILTINDLFLGLNTVMDSEVLTIVNSVVKRCGDSSNFLGEVAENAILQMIDSVNSLRALHGLISNCEHRNSSIRGKVVGFMLVLLMRKGMELRGSRELETLRTKLSKLLGDSAPEARAGSRSIVKLLLEQGLYTKGELEQYISIDQINKSLKDQTPMYTRDSRGASSISPKRSRASSTMSSGNNSVTSSPIRATQKSFQDLSGDEYNSNEAVNIVKPKTPRTPKTPVGRLNTPSRATAAAAKRELESNSELMLIPDLSNQLLNQNWIDRRSALNQLTEIITNHHTVLKNANKLDNIIDRILEKLEDGSVKIQLCTLECLQIIHEKVPTILPSIQLIIVPTLLSVASSSNKQVSSSTFEFLLEYISSLSPHQIIPQLCSIASHDKDRTRVMSFKVISELISKYSQSAEWNSIVPSLVKKHIFSLLLSTLFGSSTKPEVSIAGIETLKLLHQSLMMNSSEKLWKWTDDLNKREEIRRILDRN